MVYHSLKEEDGEDSFDDSDYSDDDEDDEGEEEEEEQKQKRHVPLVGREWNSAFQDIMDKDPLPEKYLALATLAHDVRSSPLFYWRRERRRREKGVKGGREGGEKECERGGRERE